MKRDAQRTFPGKNAGWAEGSESTLCWPSLVSEQWGHVTVTFRSLLSRTVPSVSKSTFNSLMSQCPHQGIMSFTSKLSKEENYPHSRSTVWQRKMAWLCPAFGWKSMPHSAILYQALPWAQNKTGPPDFKSLIAWLVRQAKRELSPTCLLEGMKCHQIVGTRELFKKMKTLLLPLRKVFLWTSNCAFPLKGKQKCLGSQLSTDFWIQRGGELWNMEII